MSDKRNLLKETLLVMDRRALSPDEIVFIGSQASGHECNWREFEKLADMEYYASYGSHEVALDLTIAFADGSSLRRWEYDGSEGWEFCPALRRPSSPKPITRLISSDFEYGLADMNPQPSQEAE